MKIGVRHLKQNDFSNPAAEGNSSVRDIIMFESNTNKKGDLFNQLVYDVFHALGFANPGSILIKLVEKLI